MQGRETRAGFGWDQAARCGRGIGGRNELALFCEGLRQLTAANTNSDDVTQVLRLFGE
jgi:hypothetical protein